LPQLQLSAIPISRKAVDPLCAVSTCSSTAHNKSFITQKRPHVSVNK